MQIVGLNSEITIGKVVYKVVGIAKSGVTIESVGLARVQSYKIPLKEFESFV